MLATGTSLGDKDATIHLQGVVYICIRQQRNSASNAGDIYLTALSRRWTMKNNIISNCYRVIASISHQLRNGGGFHDADGARHRYQHHRGTITVNNAGFGMMALNGGTAINRMQSPTADAGDRSANELVGTAFQRRHRHQSITSGIINIDADYGQPFRPTAVAP